ncbi:MAG: ATP-binding protein [Planctomycetota bacterium]
MTPVVLSDMELLELLGDIESDRAERKESLSGDSAKKIRQAICAFANDLPGHGRPGVIFVGARDDGTPSELRITDKLLLQLADMKSDGNIVPPLTMTVEKRHLSSADMAIVTIAPSDAPPVRYRGRIWISTSPRRDIATAQDERILNERRRHGDLPFDVKPVKSAQLDDLSRKMFEGEYLPSAIAPDVLDANERTFEQRLAATKMIVGAEDPRPTVLGVIVLSPRTRDFLPDAYLQFLRIRGSKLSDPVADEQAIDGPLCDIIRRIDEKLEAHNATSVDFVSETREIRRSTYPRGALQQVIRNAVMHRSYEATNAPVRITWYDDRIEVWSPGGPFGSVRSETFGQPGVTDYRNPNLSEAMRTLGFVQRFGVGLATAQHLLHENGNPALEFDVQATHVGVTLRARS